MKTLKEMHADLLVQCVTVLEGHVITMSCSFKEMGYTPTEWNQLASRSLVYSLGIDTYDQHQELVLHLIGIDMEEAWETTQALIQYYAKPISLQRQVRIGHVAIVIGI
jgi:hypothetical protein